MLKRIFAILAVAALSVTLVDAHGDATHITGTITSIEGDHIQIKDQAGKTVSITLQKTTKYLKSKSPSSKTELKVGTRVLVDAKMDEKTKMYEAEEVSIGVTEPAKPEPAKSGTTKTK